MKTRTEKCLREQRPMAKKTLGKNLERNKAAAFENAFLNTDCISGSVSHRTSLLIGFVNQGQARAKKMMKSHEIAVNSIPIVRLVSNLFHKNVNYFTNGD